MHSIQQSIRAHQSRPPVGGPWPVYEHRAHERPHKRANAEQTAARDQLVLDHLPLVRAIAARIRETLPPSVELDDLTHAGIMGLIAAATRFDPHQQVSFSLYAKHRIRGAILDSLRQIDWASRHVRRRRKQMEAATRELSAELQRTPTEDEIADRMGLDKESWRALMLEMRVVHVVSADSRLSEQDDLPSVEYADTVEAQPDRVCARNQMRLVLDKAMTVLPDRYKQVVTMYYVNDMTMKEIGAALGVNESRVSQIHSAALDKMSVALHRAGIHSMSCV